MKKIALLTDLHFGAMNDSDIMLNHQRQFFDGCFFPYMKEHNIDTIVSLGDTFHKRKNINFNTLKKCREFFFDVIIDNNYKFYDIIGNHNLYFKNVNDVNSPELLFSNYENINIISDAKEVKFGNLNVLMLPWINKDNNKKCFDAIKRTKSDYLFGHFEVSGVELYKGATFKCGTDINVFKKFEMVFSGHYHIKTKIGNFFYIGTPYDMDMADCDHEKGFYILDTDTKSLEFIKNPYTLFSKIEYDDEKIELTSLKNKIVKIILNKQPDFKKYDKFISSLKEMALELRIDERYLLKSADDDTTEEFDLESTDFLGLLNLYINDVYDSAEDQKDDLIEILTEVYKSAKEIQTEKGKW